MSKISAPATKTDILDLKKDNQLLNKRFDDLEDKLTVWRSEIHDLIDTGFTSKAKKLDEETDILNARTADLRYRTEKLEVKVFGKTI